MPHSLPDFGAIPIYADAECGAAMGEAHAPAWSTPGPVAASIDTLLRALSTGPVGAGRQIFVAAHHGNFPNVEYLATALRDRGVQTIGIYLRTPPPEGTFDVQLSLQGSLAALFELARRLPPSSIYLQAHGRWSFLSQILLAAQPEHSVVQELWDWMSAFIEPEYEGVFIDAGVFGRAGIRAMRISEAFIRQRCAGFLYKEGGAHMEALAASSSSPSHRFYPCPPARWMKDPTSAVHDGPIRLVHAGQIKNRSAPAAAFGDLHYLPVIRQLCEAGFQVTAFGSASGPGLCGRAAFSDYVEEAARNADFRFEPRRPIQALIETLQATQDLGLLLYRFGPQLRVGRNHLRSAVASKLFTYVAAGLPIVVSPELETMARFVEEHQIGIVAGFDDIQQLPARIASSDRARWAVNLRKVQASFALDRHLDTTLEFIRAPGRRSAA